MLKIIQYVCYSYFNNLEYDDRTMICEKHGVIFVKNSLSLGVFTPSDQFLKCV